MPRTMRVEYPGASYHAMIRLRWGSDAMIRLRWPTASAGDSTISSPTSSGGWRKNSAAPRLALRPIDRSRRETKPTPRRSSNLEKQAAGAEPEIANILKQEQGVAEIMGNIPNLKS